MKYRNTKTGAIIDSSCVISGGNWVREDEKARKDETTETPVEKTVKPKPTRKRR